MPVAAPTVAIAEEPLDHVPPAEASVSNPTEPAHKVVVPLMAAGKGSTVTVCVILQLVGSVYVMDALPSATPLTTPVTEPIDAMVKSLLLHVPPVDTSVRTIDEPVHTEVGPDIAAGSGSTVSVAILEQPVGNVYVITE